MDSVFRWQKTLFLRMSRAREIRLKGLASKIQKESDAIFYYRISKKRMTNYLMVLELFLLSTLQEYWILSIKFI